MNYGKFTRVEQRSIEGSRAASPRNGFAFGGRVHMWLLIARVACRGWDGEGDICTHTGPSGAAWCTVEREYKRLKAKRKQTGSSSSKPNSGGVKLRCALSGARKLSSLCFPLYFHITSLNAPLNSKRRESRVQF